MFMLLTSVRLAVRLAPFLALPLLGTLAAGCGEGSQVDPTIKVERGKDRAESVLNKRAPRGATKQNPAVDPRVRGGPE
jgi:hypothetical protein